MAPLPERARGQSSQTQHHQQGCNTEDQQPRAQTRQQDLGLLLMYPGTNKPLGGWFHVCRVCHNWTGSTVELDAGVEVSCCKRCQPRYLREEYERRSNAQRNTYNQASAPCNQQQTLVPPTELNPTNSNQANSVAALNMLLGTSAAHFNATSSHSKMDSTRKRARVEDTDSQEEPRREKNTRIEQQPQAEANSNNTAQMFLQLLSALGNAAAAQRADGGTSRLHNRGMDTIAPQPVSGLPEGERGIDAVAPQPVSRSGSNLRATHVHGITAVAAAAAALASAAGSTAGFQGYVSPDMHVSVHVHGTEASEVKRVAKKSKK